VNISSYPYEFAIRAAAVLGSELEASVTLHEHGLSVRAGSSTDAAARCDQAEALAADGPCIDAMEQDTTLVVREIPQEPRWREWQEQVARERFVSAMAVPAPVDDDTAVALNLYSRTPDPWTPGLVRAAEAYARLLAAAVRLHMEVAAVGESASGVYSSMSDAKAVERAVGAIMHTNGCSEDEARRILLTACTNRNVTQREVAETILRALVLGDSPRAGSGAGSRGRG